MSLYKQCTHCIIDTNDDPHVTFDSQGVCSYCQVYQRHHTKFVKVGADGESELKALLKRVKESGKNKKYDCIIGLSGGVDSSYLALKVSQWGLRALAVHFDNGWNSELAVKNIEQIISKLNIDLYTLVIDWEEFRNLQLAFIKASVVDIEMITDHAIVATLYNLAIEHGIKFILSGSNYVTEAILPHNWIHHKADYVHIEALQMQYNKKPLVTYPLLDLKLRMRAEFYGIQSASPLNLIPYVKTDAIKELQELLGWRDYGGKHYESVFTRFYQGYILPKKFKIDKRKAHLSNLICSGQMTREEALAELAKPIYEDNLLRTDYDFVLKKLDLSPAQFEEIMNSPPREHTAFPVEREIYDRVPALKIVKPFWQYFKKSIKSKW